MVTPEQAYAQWQAGIMAKNAKTIKTEMKEIETPKNDTAAIIVQADTAQPPSLAEVMARQAKKARKEHANDKKL